MFIKIYKARTATITSFDCHQGPHLTQLCKGRGTVDSFSDILIIIRWPPPNPDLNLLFNFEE